MDSFILSSNGANDLICNNITSDNISVISSLTVSGTNILSSLGTINTNINNINTFVGSSSSSLNITGTTKINFNVGTQFTTINLSGLSVFHAAKETFPFTYAGMYNVSDRLNSLYQCMSDSPECLINFDSTHNTVIRIREQDTVNQIYYPRQLQIQSYQGTAFSKFDIQGLQVLDTNNNWYYINKMFTMTNNSILLCSNNIKVDSVGQLNVQNVVTNYVLGIATGTTGTWFSVKDSIINSISGVSSLSSRCDDFLANLTTISGNAANIANIANYYSGLQSSLAVTNGVVSTAGLILAFDLKQDRFDVKAPLSLRTPVPANGEYFKQLELKINPTLLVDTGILSINTRDFLTPTYGDLAMVPTPSNITTSSSMSYVAVKQLSNPMTCMSSLNVSGYTTLNDNVTCMNNLNINGGIFCSSINSSTTTVLTTNLNSLSTYSNLNISNLQSTSTTIFNNLNSISTYSNLNISNLQSTSTTILNNLNSLSSCSTLNVNNLNVSGTSIFDNDVVINANLYALNIPKKSTFNLIITTPCMIGTTTYYRYDLDLRLYTKVLTIAPTTTTRKFKFMCWLKTGAHNAGLYSLNYDIDYSFCTSLTKNNGLNALAYGYPYENLRLNKITPNGLFIWKVDFDYITIFSLLQINLQVIIIDYL